MNTKIAILGDGRVAQAIQYLAAQNSWCELQIFMEPLDHLQSYDVILGALPGCMGRYSLAAALASQRSLVDRADVETAVYEEHENAIETAGISVIPGAGFCPGLVNWLIGHELATQQVREVEVMAGSLSSTRNYFPFLSCFEDMAGDFDRSSFQKVNDIESMLPPWAGYREESIGGIAAESYLGASGFENLMRDSGVPTFTFRHLRPRGFQSFFQFLHSYGAFDLSNLAQTKELLEDRLEDNVSLARIRVASDTHVRTWEIQSSTNADSPLSSMQLVTGAFALEMLRLAASGTTQPGLIWCEGLAQQTSLTSEIVENLRGYGVTIEVQESTVLGEACA